MSRNYKIYDCFLFFNELELLDIRLNVHNDFVDYFVLLESTKTFSNKEKELYYENNKHLFSKFKDKIIHIILDELPDFKNTKDKFGDVWHYDHYQRNQLVRGLDKCNDNDVIILSDLDEIVNPVTIKEVVKQSSIVSLFFYTFYYYLNYLRNEKWYKPKVFRKKHLNEYTMQEIRDWTGEIAVYPNGGWHFSFLGGEEKIKYKIDSYAHQQFNNEYVFSNIKSNIENGKDIFNRNVDMKLIDIDKSFPKYIYENKETFIKKGLIKEIK